MTYKSAIKLASVKRKRDL